MSKKSTTSVARTSTRKNGKAQKAAPAPAAKPEAKDAGEAKAKAIQAAAAKRIEGRFLTLAINAGPSTLDAIAKKCGVTVERVKNHIAWANAKRVRVKLVEKTGAVSLVDAADPIVMRKTADAIGEKYSVDFTTPKFAVAKS